jgi:hypothetical protein
MICVRPAKVSGIWLSDVWWDINQQLHTCHSPHKTMWHVRHFHTPQRHRVWSLRMKMVANRTCSLAFSLSVHKNVLKSYNSTLRRNSVKIVIFWAVTQRNFVGRYRCSQGNMLTLPSWLKVGAASFSRTSVSVHKITRCSSPEDHNLNNHYKY